MGQTNARMDCFKLHDLKKKKSHLMLIDIFVSITCTCTLHGGGKFSINPAKHCLLRLIELHPGECLF